MRVQVSPQRVEWIDGDPIVVTVSVMNTGDLIGGYRLRVLGADPGWVTLSAENLSLFPGMTEEIRAVVKIPEGIGAGDRRIAIQVRELTPPGAIAVAEIDLVVPAQDNLHIRLSPMTVLGGSKARFGVTAENTGNRTVHATLVGVDPEAKIKFLFTPGVITLAPGEHAITDLQTRAKRRIFGSPVVRGFAIGVLPPPEIVPAPEVEPLAQGTFLQKAYAGRGAISLLGLLLAITVFAIVITVAFSSLAGSSAADRDLAIQVAAARDASGDGTGGSSGMGGLVTLLTSGAGAPGVAVEIFSAGDLTTPFTSTATGDDGAWNLDGIAEGTYKIRFRGAGFAEVWFPAALTGDNAEEVKLQPGQSAKKLDVVLGGLPANISGKVLGDDPAGAILAVQIPASDLPGAPATTAPGTTVNAPGTTTNTEPATADPNALPGATVLTLPIGSDGKFLLEGLSSPGVYDLVVTKPGFATSTQRVDLSGGENRDNIEIRLRTGDGLISGTVSGPDGPLGEAVITATLGQNVVTTVSLTGEDAGTFTLRGLVTPSSYAVTVSLPGYTSQTSTISLSAGQKLADIQLTLAKSSGTLAGTVTTLADNQPAPGVTVTVTTGEKTIGTVTQSAGNVGAWTVAGLPIPSTYTITFSRPDLQPQTVAVSLDATGQVSSGSQGEGVTAEGISVGMRSAKAEVFGVVTQTSKNQTTEAVGEAVLTLSSGTETYTVNSASTPEAATGDFRISGITPGTYTMSVSRRGTAPTSAILTLTAGQVLEYNPELIPPASVSGTVSDQQDVVQPDVEVSMYLSTQYPAQTYRTTTTDGNGQYSFEDVDAPQSYVIEVRTSAAGVLGSTTVVLAASEAAEVDIKVGPPIQSSTSPAPNTAVPETTTESTTATTTQSTTVTVEESPDEDPSSSVGGGSVETSTDPTTTSSSTTTTSTDQNPTVTEEDVAPLRIGSTDSPGSTPEQILSTFSFTLDELLTSTGGTT